MTTTIDSAGRIVVPKALREAMGLQPGDTLQLELRDDGRLEMAVPLVPMTLEQRGGVLTAVPDDELPPLTGDLVRETLEHMRR